MLLYALENLYGFLDGQFRDAIFKPYIKNHIVPLYKLIELRLINNHKITRAACFLSDR